MPFFFPSLNTLQGTKKRSKDNTLHIFECIKNKTHD